MWKYLWRKFTNQLSHFAHAAHNPILVPKSNISDISAASRWCITFQEKVPGRTHTNSQPAVQLCKASNSLRTVHQIHPAPNPVSSMYAIVGGIPCEDCRSPRAYCLAWNWNAQTQTRIQWLGDVMLVSTATYIRETRTNASNQHFATPLFNTQRLTLSQWKKTRFERQLYQQNHGKGFCVRILKSASKVPVIMKLQPQNCVLSKLWSQQKWNWYKALEFSNNTQSAMMVMYKRMQKMRPHHTHGLLMMHHRNSHRLSGHRIWRRELASLCCSSTPHGFKLRYIQQHDVESRIASLGDIYIDGKTSTWWGFRMLGPKTTIKPNQNLP